MKLIRPILVLICSVIIVAGCEKPRNDNDLQVTVFKGGFATVNSFIFSNGKSLVVLDVQRKIYEAKKLGDVIKSKGLPLTHILISHGHTDHFTGMPWFRKEFPDAKIVVANGDIKQDIKDYAMYLDGWGGN